MKILSVTGTVFPQPSNNTNLLLSVLCALPQSEEIRLLAPEPHKGLEQSFIRRFPIRFTQAGQGNRLRERLTLLRAKLTDRSGFSDAIHVDRILRATDELYREDPFDAVICISEPFSSAAAGINIKCRGKRLVYIMDPPEIVRGDRGTAYRNRMLGKMLCGYDAILTTPFIRQALSEHGYSRYDSRIIEVGFPMIRQQAFIPTSDCGDGRIHLLFCGWLYSNIRSPKYFLDILSRLDERFVVTFMGKECEKLTERFSVQTNAELITLPQQPYETALQAMAEADILINIGNSVPVHMPSKTLEYINTGKPFVNFHKMDDCPTLYYTKRYPLCLNMSERDPDLDAAAERFAAFCLQNSGRTVDRVFIEEEYAECTPDYIAKTILDALKP